MQEKNDESSWVVGILYQRLCVRTGWRRITFLMVVGVIAFLEGSHLGPIGGLGWVIGALALTIILAVGWMRSYWNREHIRSH